MDVSVDDFGIFYYKDSKQTSKNIETNNETDILDVFDFYYLLIEKLDSLSSVLLCGVSVCLNDWTDVRLSLNIPKKTRN